MYPSYFIRKHVSQSQQWAVILNPTADTPLQIRGLNQARKNAFYL